MMISTVAAEKSNLEAALARFFPGSQRAEQNGREHYGTKVSGAALVAEFMKFVGVEVIFGIPGGNSLPLNDALTHAHVDGAFRYILTGHEQGAAFEAEGYAAASGKPGFCTATSGPGATNLITGLADAFRDSRPVVALTGNAATTAENEAFQALDIVAITDGKATKRSLRPSRPDEVQDILVQAFHLAVTGRPGAVLVDFPKDVQSGETTMRPWEELIDRLTWQAPAESEDRIRELADWLATAKRPFLYVGHGTVLADAAEEVRALSHDYQIPVATTVHALGVLDAEDPLNLGMIGMHGTVAANLAAYRSDLTIALGARFDDRTVSARPECFAPRARLVHVEVDRHQINRVRRVDLAIHDDVKHALRRLLKTLDAQGQRPSENERREWLGELAQIRQAMPIASYDRPESETLNHEYVYATLARMLRERDLQDVVATFDVGTHQMKGAQWFPISRPRSFITSGGMGSMGCAVPMAVGAAMARPEATLIANVGDGGFVMSSHELDTIGAYRLPVKIILFDDAHLGMVTNWHSLFFEGRKLTSDRRRDRPIDPIDVSRMKKALFDALESVTTEDQLSAVICRAAERLAGSEWPLFAGVAAAYGIPAERIHTKEQLPAAFQRMLATDGPYLIHVELPQQSQVFPLIPPGKTLRDLIWRETEPGSGEVIRVSDRYDFEAGRLRD